MCVQTLMFNMSLNWKIEAHDQGHVCSHSSENDLEMVTEMRTHSENVLGLFTAP